MHHARPSVDAAGTQTETGTQTQRQKHRDSLQLYSAALTPTLGVIYPQHRHVTITNLQVEFAAPAGQLVEKLGAEAMGLSKRVSSWTVEEVLDWMQEQYPDQMGTLHKAIMKHDISGRALLRLKDHHLELLGWKLRNSSRKSCRTSSSSEFRRKSMNSVTSALTALVRSRK
ncbi:hypothetical protein INR49_016127 [Caranx melampygus]|nr:hypothetical protein INR49_016127 [Caranx melampygus]